MTPNPSIERTVDGRPCLPSPAALLWLLACAGALFWPAAVGAQAAVAGAVTESRIALVIGNAAYRRDPLDYPVNDARLVADALRRAGFEVVQRENLDRGRLVEALREFGERLGETTVAVLYYAGHGLQLRDRNYLIPIDAEIRSADEIPIAGVDLGYMLGRMSQAKSRINIVILDACRNNPFEGRPGSALPQGLAQTDAPVGTLLAFATGPGKVAVDGGGGDNSVYTANLVKMLPTPGLPVELMFKRVREAVVRQTQALQVPWESSSLQGEFAFVPGAAAPEVANAADAAAELAFWNSIEGSSSAAGEYRAYLRQYPRGRFAELAQARIAAIAPADAATRVAPSPVIAGVARADLLPRAGDSWRYRVQDRFRLGDLFVTARVDEVRAGGIAETWSSTSDARLRSTLVPLQPGFHALPDWTLTPPEFAPYLLAALAPGQRIGEQQRRIEQVLVPLQVRIEAEEDVDVAAGRFRAVKLVLRGQAGARGTRGGGVVSAEQVVWYAPQAKRIIKATVSTRVGATLTESTLFELIEYRLH
jgi:uncharacterized caspase-like protein